MTTVASMPITDQLYALLEGLSGVTAYRSEVPDNPPQLPDSDRVAPYVVLYPFPGKPVALDQQPLTGAAVDLDYGCQITCVAGFSADCEYLVDRVHGAVFNWSPTLAGLAVGRMRPPVGFDPGPVAINRSILPPRFSVPLQYRLTATAS